MITVTARYQISSQHRIIVPWQSNLMTDAGLKSLDQGNGSPFDSGAQMQLGSGTGTPTVSDTAMFNHLATSNNRIAFDESFQPDNAPFTATAGMEWTFDDGDAAGTITELGIYNDSLLTHSVFDNPAQVLDDETVTVRYEIQLSIDTQDTGTILDDVGYTMLLGRCKAYMTWGDMAKSFMGQGSNVRKYDFGTDLGDAGVYPVGNRTTYSGSDVSYTKGDLVQTPNGYKRSLRMALTDDKEIDDIEVMALENNEQFVTPKFEFNPAFDKPIDEKLFLTWELEWQRAT